MGNACTRPNRDERYQVDSGLKRGQSSATSGNKKVNFLKAVKSGDIELAKVALEIDPECIKNRSFISKNTVWHIAAVRDDNKMLQFLIDYAKSHIVQIFGSEHLAPQDVFDYISNFINQTNVNGLTPLSLASYQGKAESVIILIKEGSNIWARDECNRTPLHNAAMMGRVLCVRALLDHCLPHNLHRGNNRYVDARSAGGLTALHMAVAYNCHRVVIELLLRGASLAPSCEGCFELGLELGPGSTPLHIAAYVGNEFAVKALLLCHLESLDRARIPDLRLRRDNLKRVPYELSEYRGPHSLMKSLLNPRFDLDEVRKMVLSPRTADPPQSHEQVLLLQQLLTVRIPSLAKLAIEALATKLEKEAELVMEETLRRERQRKGEGEEGTKEEKGGNGGGQRRRRKEGEDRTDGKKIMNNDGDGDKKQIDEDDGDDDKVNLEERDALNAKAEKNKLKSPFASMASMANTDASSSTGGGVVRPVGVSSTDVRLLDLAADVDRVLEDSKVDRTTSSSTPLEERVHGPSSNLPLPRQLKASLADATISAPALATVTTKEEEGGSTTRMGFTKCFENRMREKLEKREKREELEIRGKLEKLEKREEEENKEASLFDKNASRKYFKTNTLEIGENNVHDSSIESTHGSNRTIHLATVLSHAFSLSNGGGSLHPKNPEGEGRSGVAGAGTSGAVASPGSPFNRPSASLYALANNATLASAKGFDPKELWTHIAYREAVEYSDPSVSVSAEEAAAAASVSAAAATTTTAATSNLLLSPALRVQYSLQIAISNKADDKDESVFETVLRAEGEDDDKTVAAAMAAAAALEKMDSKVELCGICLSEVPDAKLDPCKHRICAGCALEFAKQLASKVKPMQCPFCRENVRGFRHADVPEKEGGEERGEEKGRGAEEEKGRRGGGSGNGREREREREDKTKHTSSSSLASLASFATAGSLTTHNQLTNLPASNNNDNSVTAIDAAITASSSSAMSYNDHVMGEKDSIGFSMVQTVMGVH